MERPSTMTCGSPRGSWQRSWRWASGSSGWLQRRTSAKGCTALGEASSCLQKQKKTLWEGCCPAESPEASSSPRHLIFFSEKNNFSQEQKVNFRNRRWLCGDPSVPIVMKTKFLAMVMVLGVISNKDDVMPPPHIFEDNLRVNRGLYHHPNQNGEALDISRCCWEPYICQHGGRPPTPPRRPRTGAGTFSPSAGRKRCNPLDNFVWGMAERDTNICPHNTKQSLITYTSEVFSNFQGKTTRGPAACSSQGWRRWWLMRTVPFAKYLVYTYIKGAQAWDFRWRFFCINQA